MARYRYVTRQDGRIESVLVTEKLPARGTPDYMRLSTHERILHGYKEAEANGIPWHGPYSKSVVKRVHEHANQRT